MTVGQTSDTTTTSQTTPTDAGSTLMGVSASAARRVAEIIANEPSGTMLRLSVEGGGCSGFQYKYELVQTREDDDLVIERDGATVLVDSVSLLYLGGAELDYVDDLIGAAFKIHNPNAIAGCGCGTSFAV